MKECKLQESREVQNSGEYLKIGFGENINVYRFELIEIKG